MANSSEPLLEMLWEPDDAQQALETRFGFADAAQAARWVIGTVDEHWGLGGDACERIVISDRNALAWLTGPSGRLIAKWSVDPERFGRLEHVSRLTRWLGDAGLPVSVPIRSLDGRLQLEAEGVSMQLQNVLDGDLLDVDDADQVWAAGAALARLHHALAEAPHAEVASPTGEAERLATRIGNWLSSAGEQVPSRARDALHRLVAEAPGDPPAEPTPPRRLPFVQHPVRGSRVTGILDLEGIRRDHCIDELARSAVLLGTRFRDWGPVSPAVRARFLSGYQSVRRLTPAETYWWDVLVLWYALIFIPPDDDRTGWGPAALSQLAQLHNRKDY